MAEHFTAQILPMMPVAVGAGDNSQTPWTQDIDGGGFSLGNAGIIDGSDYRRTGQPLVESGLFTPVLNFGGNPAGFAYAMQSGVYTHTQGGMTFLNVNILLTAKGSGTGPVTITGLPFISGQRCIGALVLNNASGVGTVVAFVDADSSVIRLTEQRTNNLVDLTNVDIAANTEFIISMVIQ